jgi:hypothetical protein
MENRPRGLRSQMPKSLRCWGLHFNPMVELEACFAYCVRKECVLTPKNSQKKGPQLAPRPFGSTREERVFGRQAE